MTETLVPHANEPNAVRAAAAPAGWFRRGIDSDIFYSFRRSRLTMIAAAVTLVFFLLAIFACCGEALSECDRRMCPDQLPGAS